ncbi:MAG: TraR/DksA family transcriptional regulator [Jatrophihabitantaceae bacterium]
MLMDEQPDSAKNREGAADRLQAARAKTIATITAIESELAAMHSAADGSNGDDEHDAEGSTIAFERAQAKSLLDHATNHLAEINDALVRAESGEYGQCERCARMISSARLAALPSTRFCVTCADLRQRQSGQASNR